MAEGEGGEHRADVPGAPDVSRAGRLDLRTQLSQHVAVFLSLKMRRTHYGLTSNL